MSEDWDKATKYNRIIQRLKSERDAARAEVVSLQWAKAALVEQQRQTQIAFAEAEQRKREAERLRGALRRYTDNDECSWGGLDNTGADWRGPCEDKCRYCQARAALGGEG